jgi:hypothetical protein
MGASHWGITVSQLLDGTWSASSDRPISAISLSVIQKWGSIMFTVTLDCSTGKPIYYTWVSNAICAHGY